MLVAQHLHQPTLRAWPGRPPFPTSEKSPVYLVFQPIRFTSSNGHPLQAWALTSRFHPYRANGEAVCFLLH